MAYIMAYPEGLRIKTTDAPVVFTAKGVVLLANKESVALRGEVIKQVTAAS